MKRLHKSDSGKKWSGVCAGIAEYFDIDPTLVRVFYAFLTIISGVIPGLIAYFVMAWIMPSKEEVKNG